MQVLKFGGTSMGSVESIFQVANIVINNHKKEPTISVVSAMSGTTNMLENLCNITKKGCLKDSKKIIKEIENKHYNTLK
jgi:aspartokinase/homoserine dehydrogenase 1